MFIDQNTQFFSVFWFIPVTRNSLIDGSLWMYKTEKLSQKVRNVATVRVNVCLLNVYRCVSVKGNFWENKSCGIFAETEHTCTMYFSESEDLAPGVKYSDCQLQHEPSSETGFSKYFLQKCVCFKGARIFSFYKLLNTVPSIFQFFTS